MEQRLKIIIPMAGRGDRMKQAGYTDSKPMIDVLGKPMIARVIENIGIPDAEYYFIVQAEDAKRYNLEEYLPTLVEHCNVFRIPRVTQGAAETVLYLQSYINWNEPILIVNSDQIICWDDEPYKDLDKIDGCIWTFKANSEKFSYARSEDNKVVEVAEKKVISDDATAGAYYWRYGKDFVNAAFRMIKKDIRTNGEFYVAPVYNEALDLNIITRSVHGVEHLGTPEELQDYIEKHGS